MARRRKEERAKELAENVAEQEPATYACGELAEECEEKNCESCEVATGAVMETEAGENTADNIDVFNTEDDRPDEVEEAKDREPEQTQLIPITPAEALGHVRGYILSEISEANKKLSSAKTKHRESIDYLDERLAEVEKGIAALNEATGTVPADSETQEPTDETDPAEDETIAEPDGTEAVDETVSEEAVA